MCVKYSDGDWRGEKATLRAARTRSSSALISFKRPKKIFSTHIKAQPELIAQKKKKIEQNWFSFFAYILILQFHTHTHSLCVWPTYIHFSCVTWSWDLFKACCVLCYLAVVLYKPLWNGAKKKPRTLIECNLQYRPFFQFQHSPHTHTHKMRF